MTSGLWNEEREREVDEHVAAGGDAADTDRSE